MKILTLLKPCCLPNALSDLIVPNPLYVFTPSIHFLIHSLIRSSTHPPHSFSPSYLHPFILSPHPFPSSPYLSAALVYVCTLLVVSYFHMFLTEHSEEWKADLLVIRLLFCGINSQLFWGRHLVYFQDFLIMLIVEVAWVILSYLCSYAAIDYCCWRTNWTPFHALLLLSVSTIYTLKN